MIVRINRVIRGALGEIEAYGFEQFVRDKNDEQNYTLYTKVCDDIIKSDDLINKVIDLTYQSQEYDYLDDVLYVTVGSMVTDCLDSNKDVDKLLALSRKPFNKDTVEAELIYKSGAREFSNTLGSLDINSLRDNIDTLIVNGGLA